MINIIGFRGVQENLVLTKKALLMVEGTRTDSKRRTHHFTPERLQLICDNSNDLLNRGGRIPVVLEHTKTASSEVGEVDPEKGQFYITTIQEKDLPNPKATDLLGKVGLYVSHVNILDPEFIEKIGRGLSRSVSMGLDLNTETIREISLVGIPSFEQAVLFGDNTDLATFASLTWEDDIDSEDVLAKLKEEYDDLCEKCWNYLSNIFTSDEAALKGRDPVSLADGTLYGFAIRVKELMGFVSVPEKTPVVDPTTVAPNTPLPQEAAPQNQSGPTPDKPKGKSTSGFKATYKLADFQKQPPSKTYKVL